jgi:alkylated DNA repair dioxygenase AlkB
MENWMRTRLMPTAEEMRSARPQGPTTIFIPGFLSAEEAKLAFEALEGELDLEPDRVAIAGEIKRARRLSDYRGDPGAQYAYSGVDRDPNPWTPTLRALRERIEAALSDRADVEPSTGPDGRESRPGFNAVLCNHYGNGEAGMGWHADKEADLGPRPLIASLSLGAARPFRFRLKKELRRAGVAEDEQYWEWTLGSGDLLLMQGRTQAWFEHCLPPRAAVKDPRLNLTFRKVVMNASRLDDALAGSSWGRPSAAIEAGAGAGSAKTGAQNGKPAREGERPRGRFVPQAPARRG